MVKHARIFAVLAAVLSVAGCNCKPTGPGAAPGEFRVVYDEGGVEISNPDGVYDFGAVGMGLNKTLKLRVTNTGSGPLTLDSITQASGDATQIGTTAQDKPVFTVAFTEPVTVTVGQVVDFDITFNAPVSADTTVKQTSHEAALTLNILAAKVAVSTVTLKGTAISGSCILPKTLDFGSVATGDSFALPIELNNSSALDVNATANPITSNSGDDKNFDYSPESPRGQIPLLAGKSRTVTFVFKPTEVHDYLALVKMRAAESCPETVVTLIGSGVDSVLTWTAPDFGYVQPGTESIQPVVFTNHGYAVVKLTDMKTLSSAQPSADYHLVAANTIDVPAATAVLNVDGTRTITPGTINVPISFKPVQLGRRDGTLVTATSLVRQALVSVSFVGFGGGPDIDVKPSPTFNLGKIAFFDTAQTGGAPYSVTRKLTIQNVGTRPPMPAAKANLHLGQATSAPYADGTTGKFWEVKAKAGTAALDSEVCVGRYDATMGCIGDLVGYDNQVGVIAGGPASLLDVPVRVTPADANGAKEWDLTIYSNDPDEAAVVINIKADAQALKPCRATISPTVLNFGLVAPPTSRDLSFNIHNDGTQADEICLVSGLDLKTGSDPIFSLPAGAVDTRELQPGETMTTLARAWPQGAVGSSLQVASGAVQFNISDPMTPLREVSLTATIGTGCLTITPNDLDFGTVKKDCFSSHRPFTVYNTCSSPITVVSLGMIAAAGEPANGPNCAGPAACPEFLVDGTPGIMPGQVIPASSSTPLTFTLKYRPINVGADNGAYLIKVTQNAQTVDYIVTLRGNGDLTGANTDIFRQDTKPKADILLVIDNSCSMDDKQQALSQNFGAFISYATTAGVDYQIGVITTSLGDADEGVLIGDANNPKILKPTTPGVEALFRAKVAVGINGGTEGSAEPAVMALTAPLITGPNAGFLRADAVLAVVVVSDAGDQSPLAASVYENQLRNIKGAQHPNQFSFNVIGPFAQTPAGNCVYDDFTDTSKEIYLTNAFGGVREEICSPDWATSLESISKRAFGYRTTFFLTTTPQNNAVTVEVNGVALAPTDPRGAPVWTYDPISNAVVFQPLYVPEPGKVLTITYIAPCGAN